jgi:hypothetical protein
METNKEIATEEIVLDDKQIGVWTNGNDLHYLQRVDIGFGQEKVSNRIKG